MGRATSRRLEADHCGTDHPPTNILYPTFCFSGVFCFLARFWCCRWGKQIAEVIRDTLSSFSGGRGGIF